MASNAVGPTLAEVLQYEPFRRASARAVAGSAALDRKLRWVHISEMPDPARLFQGNELLLTQGRGLSRDPKAQRQWVRELVSAGLAGVAVELRVVFDAIPEAIRSEAEALNFPVIELQRPAYFMDMTEAVHSAIIHRHYSLLRRAENVSRDFSRLVTQGYGIDRLISELAEIIGNPVILDDQAHQVLEFARIDPDLLEWLPQWQVHARAGHLTAHDNGAGRTTGGEWACMWQPVVVRGDTLGGIHVLEKSRPCDGVDLLALDRATAAVGLLWAAEVGRVAIPTDRRSRLVREIVQGRLADVGEVQRILRVFGVRPDAEMAVAVLQPLERRTWDAARLSRMMHQVARDLRNGPAGTLVGEVEGQVIVLESELRRSEQQWTELVAHWAAQPDPVDLVVGIGEPAGLHRLPVAYRDAADAARHALRTSAGPAVQRSSSLGIDRLLLQLDDGSSLAGHIQRELGPVLDHDATSPNPLMPTLLAYLERNGNKTRIAADLHIERRTLYYRVEKLEELLGGSLEDAERRAGLYFAARALRYARAAGSAGRTAS